MDKNNTNRFFRLPFRFDAAQLERDLSICLDIHWQEHFNRQDYAGDWSGIALRSATGKIQDIYAKPSGGYLDTPLLERCAYFKEIIGMFQWEKETIRLLRLAARSIVKEHRDLGAGYAHGAFRVHIPIRTDAAVSFVVDGCELPMKA